MFGNVSDMQRKIIEVEGLLKNDKDIDIRVALCGYLSNLYSAIYSINGYSEKISKKKIFGNLDNYQKYLKKSDVLNDRFYDSVVFYKDFHQNLFYEILLEIDTLFFESVCGKEYSLEDDSFKEDDFFSILEDFLSSLNLEDIYKEIISSQRIFRFTGMGGEDYSGITLHNPVTGESNILVKDFKYDLNTLFTLVHEVGHYYDLVEFNNKDSVYDYLSYVYKSCYVEVISLLFEKLFIDYLISHNIKSENTVDLLIDSKIHNYSRLYSAYIFSLLDDIDISKRQFKKFDSNRFISLVKEKLDDVYPEFIGDNLEEEFVYAYGDYVSMFLKDEIIRNGFNNELLKKFNQIRYLEFDDDFITLNGLMPKTYKKIYSSEIKKINK